MSPWFTKRFAPRLWEAAQKWQADDGPTWAASLGYYAAFSFFPLVMVLLAGAGMVVHVVAPEQRFDQADLLKLLGERTSPAFATSIGDVLKKSPELARQLDTLVSGLTTHAVITASISLAILIYGAIGIFTQLDSAFDRIWNVQVDPHRKRGWLGMVRNVLFVRFRAFLMLLGLLAIVVIAFLAAFAVPWIARHAGFGMVRHLLFRSLNALLGIGVNASFFALAYHFLPKRPVSWRRAFAGGLLAALFWEIGRQLLTLFLIGDSYTAYGVVGSFILMMLWFNYASMVLLYGAEYVAIGCQRDAASCDPEGAAKK